MIHGIGIDVVDIARFESALNRRGQRLKNRLFTPQELAYCMSKRRPATHLAVRFAAKEAFFKAVSNTDTAPNPFRFKEVEITRDESGRPGIRAKGLDEGCVAHLSMSHEGEVGTAVVVVERHA